MADGINNNFLNTFYRAILSVIKSENNKKKEKKIKLISTATVAECL